MKIHLTINGGGHQINAVCSDTAEAIQTVNSLLRKASTTGQDAKSGVLFIASQIFRPQITPEFSALLGMCAVWLLDDAGADFTKHRKFVCDLALIGDDEHSRQVAFSGRAVVLREVES